MAPWTVSAAVRITSITKSGWESMGTWLLATSVTLAPMRLATNRSMSGWTVRSFLATMYQLGFDLQAVPPTFALNRSAAGPKWVAQTSFFSCSDTSRDAGFCLRRFHFALLIVSPHFVFDRAGQQHISRVNSRLFGAWSFAGFCCFC